jgi:hypothetical protein
MRTISCRMWSYISIGRKMNGCFVVGSIHFVREEGRNIVNIYRRCLPLCHYYLASMIFIFSVWRMTKMPCNIKSETTYYSTTILQCNNTTSITTAEYVSSSYTSHDHRNNDPQKENAHFSIRKYNLLYYCRSTLLGWSRCDDDDDDVIHIHYFLPTCKCPYRRTRGLFSIEKFEEGTMMMCAPPTLQLLQKIWIRYVHGNTPPYFKLYKVFRIPICQGDVTFGGDENDW